MYRDRPADARLGFGDIIQAPWLFDLYLREDAAALQWADSKKGPVLIPMPEAPAEDRQGRRDHVLAAGASGADFDYAVAGHGNSRRAIVLSDDCALETRFGRAGQLPDGRIIMAAVRNATADEVALAARKKLKFDIFALPEANGMSPGIALLDCAFAVHATAFVAADERAKWTRLAALDEGAQRDLAEKWCAHATRHGPLVARVEANKLAKMMTAAGDPEVAALLDLEPPRDDEGKIRRHADGSIEAHDDGRISRLPDPAHSTAARHIYEAANAMWSFEGATLDDVADAWVERAPPDESRRRVIEALQEVRSKTDAALVALGDTSWNPASLEHRAVAATNDAQDPDPAG